MCIFASDNSERSLVIQNSVPQSTPLISKSLPIHLSLKGNTLLINKIVRKRKILMVLNIYKQYRETESIIG